MKLSLKLKLPGVRSWLRLIPLSTLLFLFAILSACILFLYQEFYQTIAQVKVVHILQSQISLSRVDVSLYQTVFQNLQAKKKTDPNLLQNLPNPFNPTATVSPTSPSAGTPPPAAKP